MSNKKINNYQAPALEKGLEIIEFLSQKASPLSQTEISNGINKTTNEIYRMLICLEERGYITRDEISGNYKLSLKLYHISHRHSPLNDIRDAGYYPMQKLSKLTKQSCHLGAIYNDKIFIVYESKSPSKISLSVEEGTLLPLLLTGSGLTLLAFMEEKKKKEHLNNNVIYQEFSRKEKKHIIQTLYNIQKKGHYVDKSKVVPGVTDIVVPIGGVQTSIYATLAIPYLSSLIESNMTIEEITKEAKSTADIILRRLGIANNNV